MFLQIAFLCSILSWEPACLSALASIILVFITAFYACSSHKMLKLSQEKHRPYIAIDTIKYNSDNEPNSLKVLLKNYGEIPAYIFRSKLDYNGEILNEKIKFDKNEIAAITPGQHGIEYRLFSNMNENIISKTRIYEYSVEYRSILKDSIIYRTKYQFKIISKNKDGIIVMNIEMI